MNNPRWEPDSRSGNGARRGSIDGKSTASSRQNNGGFQYAPRQEPEFIDLAAESHQYSQQGSPRRRSIRRRPSPQRSDGVAPNSLYQPPPSPPYGHGYVEPGLQAPIQPNPYAHRPGRGSGSSTVNAPLARKAPRRKHRLRRFFITVGALFLVFAIAIASSIFWLDGKLNRVDALSTHVVAGTPGINWLLVGSDSRDDLSAEQRAQLTAGDTAGKRTDTIMLLHIPSGSHNPTLVSLPRDSYVDIPGYGNNKINAAFALGGPSLLVQTVEKNTGIYIDHYAEIGFGGFASVIDAIGGIDICVDQAINDPMAGADLKAGCQVLNGTEALSYVRSRYTSANGDLDRVRRQRQTMTSIIEKLSSFGVWANPFRFWPAISKIASSLTVDNGDHIWHLVRAAWALLNGPQMATVPIAGFRSTDVGSVVLWGEDAANFFLYLKNDQPISDNLLRQAPGS